ncbi:MAG TPA: hypothetical protein VFT64_04575 [Rickettsiales bacterium]|nr:hypothetical protein [Rickettsiales bacterium]
MADASSSENAASKEPKETREGEDAQREQALAGDRLYADQVYAAWVANGSHGTPPC